MGLSLGGGLEANRTSRMRRKNGVSRRQKEGCICRQPAGFAVGVLGEKKGLWVGFQALTGLSKGGAEGSLFRTKKVRRKIPGQKTGSGKSWGQDGIRSEDKNSID